MKNTKRYKECNTLIKILRHRYYIPVLFKFIFNFVKPLEVTDDVSGEKSYPKKKLLWQLLIGEAQFKMNYYYTFDEVKKNLDNLK